MKIFRECVTNLKFNESNPRVINADKFDKLLKSIKEAPWMLELRPLIITRDKVVIGGNMRLKALLALGVADVPVMYADDLDDEKQREFVVKDNLSFGDWDFDELRLNWDVPKLADWGLELPPIVQLGDTDASLNDANELDEQTDIVLGDVFEIGPHRLLCGDSNNTSLIAEFLRGVVPDFVFSDPMYQDNAQELAGMFVGLGVNHYLLMMTFKQFIEFIPVSGLNFRFDLVFDQKVPSSSMNKRVPYYLHKNIVYLTRGKETVFNCDYAQGQFSEKGYYPSIIEASKNTSEQHGLTKNCTGIRKMLSGFKSHTVYDPFLGSGSTMAAAEQLGRVCYGVEIEPRYCAIIVQRMRSLCPDIVIKRNGELY